jgi:hypothetical protein
MISFIYQWIDFIWLPVGWLVVKKEQRITTSVFILTCLLTLRTQVELMEGTSFETGILPFMTSSMLSRGMVVYGVIISLFLVLVYYSPQSRGIIFFAAVISIYIFAFCISMILMLF